MEKVTVELTWDELEMVLMAVKYVKGEVEIDDLNTAYVKLSTKYKRD